MELAAASGRAVAPASPALQQRLLQLHRSRRRSHRSRGCHNLLRQWSGCREWRCLLLLRLHCVVLVWYGLLRLVLFQAPVVRLP
jgi:hypothetical protein